MAAPATPVSRPPGVTILAVLYILGGVLSGIFGFGIFAFSAAFGLAGAGAGEGVARGILGFVGAMGAVAGALVMLYGLVLLVVGIGLFARGGWAWYAALVVAGIQIALGLFALLGFELISATFNLLVGGFIAWYLLSPRVQAWFRVAHRTPWRYDRAT